MMVTSSKERVVFMSFYEHIFLVSPNATTQKVESLADDYANILTDGGAVILRKEFWGIRPLAYPIKKNENAHYVYLRFSLPSTKAYKAVEEMDRQMRLDDTILRCSTMALEKADDGPSIVAQKRDHESSFDRTRPRKFDSPRPRFSGGASA
jgi:small subunit ribosomal protein S6